MKTYNQIQLHNLTRLMREHHITIRQLAAHMDITMKRVREVRNLKPISLLSGTDFIGAIFAIVEGRQAAQAAVEQTAGVR